MLEGYGHSEVLWICVCADLRGGLFSPVIALLGLHALACLACMAICHGQEMIGNKPPLAPC